MSKITKAVNKSIREDARAGTTVLRQLKLPAKAKRKDGDDIHKLPAFYPVIKEYEDDFKKKYTEIMTENFFNKLGSIIK